MRRTGALNIASSRFESMVEICVLPWLTSAGRECEDVE